jgi:hypothetical protein
MALSNWDTMAINKNGKPIAGRFTTPSGVTLEIYKNWAHILDTKAWTKEDSHFVEPVIMTIQNGYLTYKDLEIYAERGPQNGIYVLAFWKDYVGDGPKGMDNIRMIWGGMAAIGCYGFEGEDWVGVQKRSIDFLKLIIKKAKKEYILEKEMFSDIDFGNAIRYCQGDGYFAEAGVIDHMVGTKVGEADTPILLKALREGNDK